LTSKQRTIAILGAGPVGLEAALYARTLGYPAAVYEAGRVGEHLIQWGHVTLFTPWALDVSPLGEGRLLETGTRDRPFDPEAFPTGAEVVAEYLLLLSRLPELSGCVHEGHRVRAVGRGDLLKGDGVGDGSRAASRFRLLVEGPDGERVEEADVVLDATGVFGQPNPLGRGGIPAPGEHAAAERILTGIPDVSGRDRERFLGKRILVVGDGASAATTVRELAALDAGTVVWATRSGSPPIPEIENDPLPSRLALARNANALAAGPAARFRHLPERSVSRLSLEEGGVTVMLAGPSAADDVAVEVDLIVNQTGFRPDSALSRELQFHECYASQGPMKLAASLLGASADCMEQTGFGPDSLISPEPDFFVIGNKSYGRSQNFLLRIGREQVRDVFRLVSGDAALDLYASETSGV
jgi:hypothetical protein